MSSPFRHFRKHSKAFMAVAAVLCMFLFVLGSAFDLRGRTSTSDGGDNTVATWKGGALTERELAQYSQQRMLVNQILLQLFVEGGGQDPRYDLPPNLAQLLIVRDIPPEAMEEVTIATEVGASLARDAGMSVSDDVINHAIQEFGQKKVSADNFRTVLGRIGGRSARANETILFETLRKMLLAQFYRQSYADAGLVVLPQQRWEDWLQVNERISLQAAVLKTDSFIDKVPDPSDAQLKAFYEEHKETYPNEPMNVMGKVMNSPAPGFAEPQRVRLQLLSGKVADRTEKWLDKVTDSEIAEYYERNKRLEFMKLDLPGDDAPAEKGTAPAESAAPAEPAADAPAPAEGAEATPGADSDDPKAADEASAPGDQEAAATEAATTEDGGAATEVDAPPSTPAPTEDAAEPAGEGEPSSDARRRSPFQLVAFQDAPADDATATAEEAPATEAAPSSDTATAPAGDESAAEPTAPAPATPAATDAAPEASSNESAPAADAASTDTAAAADEDDIIEYEPLDKVSDDIRRQLAKEKAVEELTRVMAEASAALQSEYNRYGSQRIAAEEAKKKVPAPPAKLTDLKWLADKYGLGYDKMVDLSQIELADSVVGRAFDPTGRTSVTAAAFQTLDLYEPFMAQDRLDGDWYLVMKTKDTPRSVPKFASVKEQVKTAWKHVEAAKLAEKKAKELAAASEKSEQPFDQFMADKGVELVKQTGYFSWRSFPAGYAGEPVPPTLSDVPELPNAGPEFMKTAFALQGNETKAVLNYDNSAAYVIRLHSRQYLPEELQKLFVEEGTSWPGFMGTLVEHNSAFDRAMQVELKDRAGLEIDPDWEARRAERMQKRN